MTAKIRESQGGAYERRSKHFIRVTIAPGKRRGRYAPWATNLEQATARGNVHEGADLLRRALLAAGVDRAELHDTSSPMRRQVRLHDLRASMVTIGLANGRTEEWIRRRTGHASSALERYRRVASTLRELA